MTQVHTCTGVCPRAKRGLVAVRARRRRWVSTGGRCRLRCRNWVVVVVVVCSGVGRKGAWEWPLRQTRHARRTINTPRQTVRDGAHAQACIWMRGEACALLDVHGLAMKTRLSRGLLAWYMAMLYNNRVCVRLCPQVLLGQPAEESTPKISFNHSPYQVRFVACVLQCNAVDVKMLTLAQQSQTSEPSLYPTGFRV